MSLGLKIKLYGLDLPAYLIIESSYVLYSIFSQFSDLNLYVY